MSDFDVSMRLRLINDLSKEARKQPCVALLKFNFKSDKNNEKNYD